MANKLEVKIKEVSYSVQNNNSVIEVTVKVYSDLSWNNDKCSGHVTIDGTQHNFSHSFSKGTTTLYRERFTMGHNAEGKKTVSASASYSTGTSLGTLSDSTSLTLTTIPRATIPSVDTKVCYTGDRVVISTPRKSTSFHHKIRYKFGTLEGTLGADVGQNISWNIPHSIATGIPKGTASTCFIYCDTYNENSQQIGSTKTTSFELRLSGVVKPHITRITCSEAVDKIKTAFEKYVKGESKLNVNITAEGEYGSTIKGYQTKISGITYKSKSFMTGFLKNAGNVSFTVKVVDSRGRTDTATKEITVLNYSEPEIFGITSERCNFDGTSNDEGDCIKVGIRGKVSSIQNNTKSLLLRYKKSTETQWTDVNIPLSAWNFDVEKLITNTIYDESYDFEAKLTDKLHTATERSQTGRIALSLLAGGKGAKFFGEADKEGFYVNDTKFPLEIKSATGSGQVAAGEYKVLASIPVTKGTYLVSGYALWRTAFTKNKLVALSLSGGGWTRLEHDSGDSQGGKTITARVTVAGDNNIELKVKHADSTTHTIIEGSLDVIKLCGTKETNTKYNLQAKTVTPVEGEQTVFADSGYYGLSSVTVKGVPATEIDKTMFAPAIRNHPIGNVHSIDDVAEFPHILKVKAKSSSVDVTQTKVRVTGKNYFNISNVNSHSDGAGSSITDNHDGSVTVKLGSGSNIVGNSNGYSSLHRYAPNLQIGKRYKLKMKSTGTDKWIYLVKAGMGWGNNEVKEITDAMLHSQLVFYASGSNSTAIISDFSITLEGEDDTYEPYQETVYNVHADGTVDDIPSIYPSMGLSSDDSSVELEVTYCADTKKYIDNKFNELAKATVNNI